MRNLNISGSKGCSKGCSKRCSKGCSKGCFKASEFKFIKI